MAAGRVDPVIKCIDWERQRVCYVRGECQSRYVRKWLLWKHFHFSICFGGVRSREHSFPLDIATRIHRAVKLVQENSAGETIRITQSLVSRMLNIHPVCDIRLFLISLESFDSTQAYSYRQSQITHFQFMLGVLSLSYVHVDRRVSKSQSHDRMLTFGWLKIQKWIIHFFCFSIPFPKMFKLIKLIYYSNGLVCCVCHVIFLQRSSHRQVDLLQF